MKKFFRPGTLVSLRNKDYYGIWLQGYDTLLRKPDGRGGVNVRPKNVCLVLESLWKNRLYVILVNEDVLVGD